MSRHLTYSAAIWEGQNLLLEAFPEVVIMGLGVPTPTGVFGTTTGLAERYGLDRIVDIPAAENGITGVALGASLHVRRFLNCTSHNSHDHWSWLGARTSALSIPAVVVCPHTRFARAHARNSR